MAKAFMVELPYLAAYPLAACSINALRTIYPDPEYKTITAFLGSGMMSILTVPYQEAIRAKLENNGGNHST